MEINIIEDKKKRLVFELKGEGHTLCNALREELWNDKSVTISAYNISHPLVGIPTFIIETSSKNPKKALKSAITRLKKKNSTLLKKVKSLR